MGGYANLVQVTGDTAAETKYLELGIGVALGNYTGAQGYVFEYNLDRRPEVTASDGEKYTALAGKLSHTFTIETKGFMIPVLNMNKYHVSLEAATESKLNPYIDTERKTTGITLMAGGGLYQRLNYHVGYTTKTIEDSTKQTENILFFSISFEGNGSISSGGDAEGGES